MKSTDHVNEVSFSNMMEFQLHGTLTREDYDALSPEIDRKIAKYGKIRVLVIMQDFHGWDGRALWQAIKWNSKHFRHLERLGVVGDKSIEVHNSSGAFDLSYRKKVRWQRWVTNFYRRFADAEVRYFTAEELDDARDWVNGRLDESADSAETPYDEAQFR